METWNPETWNLVTEIFQCLSLMFLGGLLANVKRSLASLARANDLGFGAVLADLKNKNVVFPIREPRAVEPLPLPAENEVCIIRRDENDLWVRVGERLESHPDVKEALLTPGLAVRRGDGTVELGTQ